MIDNLTKLTTREIGEGMVACLKSGGPRMVVMLRKTDMALCQWHIENGELTSAWLQISCLELVK